MKEWLTAREIAAEALPELPATESAVVRLAKRNCWDGRPREGRGGGVEYHFHTLPIVAQAAYAQRHMTLAVPAPTNVTPDAARHDVSERARLERDARLAILAHFSRFTRGLKLSNATLLQVFCDRYNAGLLDVDGWVRDTVPSVSKRTVMRWRAARQDGKAIGHDPALARKGTGILETANGGRVRAFILGLIAHQPFVAAHHVRTLCRAEFGDTIIAVSKGVETAIEMPPVRTFQHTLKVLKERHKVELVKLTNPDLYRSTLAPSGVGTLRHVTEPNQLWQIDASPVDALCTDGRHAIYACVDIATRRTVWFLSKTPRASAVALLIRKAIIAWGVPEVIKTDNGSDFVARDTQRLFASLGIEVDLSDAYSPEQKGHVERVIRTFQHDVGPLLPGFVGHSVADRKAIESRKSFAKRLGETEAETFGVTLSGPDLQKHVDEWADLVYQHRPHAGLKQQTPFLVAQASRASIRTVKERALDLLLMPVAGGNGQRQVTKFGIRIDGFHYMTQTIMPGTSVFVRQDPNDLGQAYCFALDGGSYLGDAVCPELRGLDPELVARERKAMQREFVEERTRPIREEARRIAKGKTLIENVLNVARRDAPNVIPLPKRETGHSTPEIAAAIEAMGEKLNPSRELSPREAAEHRRLIDDMTAEAEAELWESQQARIAAYQKRVAEERVAGLPDNVAKLPESALERFRRAVRIEAQIKAGAACDPNEAHWLGGYQQSAEYRSQAQMHADFGDAYLS